MPQAYDVQGDLGAVAQTPYSLLRVIGGWGNVNGPALLMLRCMVSGTTSAALCGLGFSMVGSTIWGTAAIPFLIGSTFGYGLGSWRWYRYSVTEALRDLDEYPQLIRLHLLSNFPWQRMLRDKKLEWYNTRTFSKDWVMESMLVAGWMTAKPALEELSSRREQKLIDEYSGMVIEETENEMAKVGE